MVIGEARDGSGSRRERCCLPQGGDRDWCRAGSRTAGSTGEPKDVRGTSATSLLFPVRRCPAAAGRWAALKPWRWLCSSAEGMAAGEDGTSSFLGAVVSSGRSVALADVGDALAHGDPVVRELVTTAAQLVGDAAARIVNFFNPGLILIGGSVAHIGDIYLATVRQTVLARALPLATRDLRIARWPLGSHPGLTGGAFLVIDELVLPGERLGRWIDQRTPVGRPDLVS